MFYGGFPLPAELMLHIISYFGINLEDSSITGLFTDLDLSQVGSRFDHLGLYIERQAALRTLSQTSRLLRSISLPVRWAYLDLHCYLLQRDDHFLERLERLALGLTENPTLAYVRCVVFPCCSLVLGWKQVFI
jgi:hypothetical protein